MSDIKMPSLDASDLREFEDISEPEKTVESKESSNSQETEVSTDSTDSNNKETKEETAVLTDKETEVSTDSTNANVEDIISQEESDSEEETISQEESDSEELEEETETHQKTVDELVKDAVENEEIAEGTKKLTKEEKAKLFKNTLASADLKSLISDGIFYLARGYIEYSQEVITNRALPDIYDGLKPVQRRILATLNEKKVTSFMKSATLSGDVLHLHPHGDASVYQSLVLMTDKNGSLAFPVVAGKGNFGGVFTTDKPAAARYTNVMLHPWSKEYFGEKHGVNYIPNYDATTTEPERLPVSFPAVLINATSGIAVGFKTTIPSFNFNDVCDLVIEYIKDGKCSTVICPDFVTGGYYIKDKKELQKLMKTGVGKIKLRGKAKIKDKEILATEIPYGKTIQGIVSRIIDKNIPSIRTAYNADDKTKKLKFKVACTTKSRTEEALYSIYKDTDFQYTMSADITVIKNGVPVRLGVWDIIEEWVKWRKEVLVKEFTYQIELAKRAAREANAIMVLINSGKKDEFVKIVTTQGRAEGKKFLIENFTEDKIPKDMIDFVSTRDLPVYYDGGRYKELEQEQLSAIKVIENNITNVSDVIVSQMEKLKKKYGKDLARRTTVTQKDIDFDEVIPEPTTQKETIGTSVYYALKNGFLRKCRSEIKDVKADRIFKGYSNEVLIGFDNKGRLLRVYCKDIPFNSINDTGTYLPRYLGFEATDDYRIYWMGRLTGDELMLIYKDGNIGFVNMHEWDDSGRRVKVLEKGIAVTIADKLGAVVENIPDVLVVTSTQGDIGVVKTKEILRKARTAKTRVFNPKKSSLLDTYAMYDEETGMSILEEEDRYLGTLKQLKNKQDFKGDEKDFIKMF